MERIIADTTGTQFDAEEHFAAPEMLHALHLADFSINKQQLLRFRNLDHLSLENCSIGLSRIDFFRIVNYYCNFPLLRRLSVVYCVFKQAQDASEAVYIDGLKNAIENATIACKVSVETALLLISQFNKFQLTHLSVKCVMLSVKDVLQLFPYLQYFNGINTHSAYNYEAVTHIRRLEQACRTERRKRLKLQSEYRLLESSANLAESHRENAVQPAEYAVVISASEYAYFSILKTETASQTEFDVQQPIQVPLPDKSPEAGEPACLRYGLGVSQPIHAGFPPEQGVGEETRDLGRPSYNVLQLSRVWHSEWSQTVDAGHDALQNSRVLVQSIDYLLNELE